ncbi:hypothetical protein PAXRUDRAFT_18219 [Paxillus rubicundulus Ve08.2h10]|uniref:Uncharacterized protein n=1 Tax=Paxillus rubicundulus Ve08.2h10 TaxID=930991 RepID=A0A0D0D824_9AGAM|nr:hypothetical protein PAXRUDRAFT_18219 [Paxillus rubicundulus Ve08.2h10]
MAIVRQVEAAVAGKASAGQIMEQQAMTREKLAAPSAMAPIIPQPTHCYAISDGPPHHL